MMKSSLAWAAAAALAAPALAAAPAPAIEEVSIPFVNFGGIWSFDAPNDHVVFVEDRSRHWYKAELAGSCFGLQWANRLGVDTRGSDTFDRFSRILVDRQSCPIASLTRSDPPQRQRSKHKQG